MSWLLVVACGFVRSNMKNVQRVRFMCLHVCSLLGLLTCKLKLA